jgi:hypothetical protein
MDADFRRSALSDPRLVVAAGHFGSPPQARNALLDLVDHQFPAARWVARMDADDRLQRWQLAGACSRRRC